MSKRAWAGVLMGLLVVGAAAQDVKAGEKLLRDTVVKKQRVLRGFSADAAVHWRWDGNSLVQEPIKAHTFGVLIARSVKVHGSKVEIAGERHTLLRSSDTTFTLSAAEENVKVEIDLKNADVASMLPTLGDMIFYADIKTALADTKMRPAEAGPKCCGQKPPLNLKPCDCVKPEGAECNGTLGLNPPSVVSSVEPEFSDEARTAKFGGNVQVYLKVDTHGKPYDIWILKPVGMGLDSRAGEAVSGYQFRPATCHGTAVPFDLYIDVNFQIF